MLQNLNEIEHNMCALCVHDIGYILCWDMVKIFDMIEMYIQVNRR